MCIMHLFLQRNGEKYEEKDFLYIKYYYDYISYDCI